MRVLRKSLAPSSWPSTPYTCNNSWYRRSSRTKNGPRLAMNRTPNMGSWVAGFTSMRNTTDRRSMAPPVSCINAMGTALPSSKMGTPHASTWVRPLFFSATAVDSPQIMLCRLPMGMLKSSFISGHTMRRLPLKPIMPKITSTTDGKMATLAAPRMVIMALAMVDLPLPPVPSSTGIICMWSR